MAEPDLNQHLTRGSLDFETAQESMGSGLLHLRSWVALNVNTRSESLVSSTLESRGYKTFSPTILERRKYSDRYKSVKVPVFSGYVLAYLQDSDKANVVSCPAVKYIVSFGGTPARIPDETVCNIRRMVENGGQPVPFCSAGELVRVEYGSLSGVEGTYLRRGAEGKLVVSIDILGRSVAVHVSPDHVTSVRRSNIAISAS